MAFASETAGRPFERWKVTTDVLRVDAVRLELPGPKWDAIDPTSTLLAGFAERGAESPLDHETTDALVKALRAPHGFDDDIVKRCAVGHLVGFRVRRSLATTADTKESPEPEVVDVAVDFTCQKLFVVRGGAQGGARTVHATHFDPSRAAFLALAKKALPADPEIAALK